MKSPRIDIASIRRQQIVEAAVGVIAEQGLQNLSLSEIETRAGMSRGQLTYYFPTKEDILLAVFDRVVVLMCERLGTPESEMGSEATAWGWVQHLLGRLLTEPPLSPEFGCLQYTFLAQMGHRKDFRKRLASLYEEWRSDMAEGFAADLGRPEAARAASPRALATLVQAILHGLIMQREADPAAFDGAQMLELCLDVLSTYLWKKAPPRQRKPARQAKTGKETPVNGRHRPRRLTVEGVNGERKHG